MRLAWMVCALALAAGRPAAAAGIEKLAWLAGAWSGDDGPTHVEETWLAPSGGTMLAVHRDVKDGRTTDFEFLRIEETPDGLVYFAMPKGQPATPFRLVESGEARAVFENATLPFPRRILYWRNADGSLTARIEGTLGGKPASKEWSWKRAR